LVLDAYLQCADQLAARGEQAQALQIYKQLYSSQQPMPIRTAALRGQVTASPDKAAGIVRDVLAADDEAMKVVAIDLVREIPGTEIIKAVSLELPNLSVTHQVQLLSALADRGEPTALPLVINKTKSAEPAVRVAALSALMRLGDASTVDLLAQTAATTDGAEQQAARGSLYRLRGPRVDETILANIQSATPAVKVELIRSVGERNITAGVKTLLKTAQDSDAKVRRESLKVLKGVADPEHLPALVDLLINAPSKADRDEAEKTVAMVAHKIPDKNRQAQAVLAVLPSVKDVTIRCSLLSVLGKIGDDSALPILRTSLSDPNLEIRDAAIRSLSDWPNAKPADDLLEMVRLSANRTHRALALRGFIRLVGLDSSRPAEETIKMYKQAMDLASSISEKRMVLSGLADVKSFEALHMAADYLDNEALQQEAEVAVIKIAEATVDSHPQQTKTVLQKVTEISKNDFRRQQAQQLIDKLGK
jgi:HEAT repeat protein